MADIDFVAELRRQDAADAARAAAIARPPRPHRAANKGALDSWLETMVREEADNVARTHKGEGARGGRDGELNYSAWRIGKHVHLGIDRTDAERQLLDACYVNGFAAEHGEAYVRGKIQRSMGEGENNPEPRPELEAERKASTRKLDPTVTKLPDPAKRSAREKNKANGVQTTDSRTVRLHALSTVASRVPQWIWTYDNVGRIQLGTLSIFAGRPAAGKSTAVRWFAARLTRGELDGVWHGVPMRVALVMTEEQTDAVIVPGLVAAGADLSMVYEPRFRFGETESAMMAIEDEARLTEELKDKQVGALFVDPIMSTFGSRADINRNNEVRALLAPYTRIAAAINGIVIGVAHLRKGDAREVLAGINGSSAFGEVPRAVFGFAPVENGSHIFQQVKNSAGPTDLKLSYQLRVTHVETDDGQTTELPAFQITGPTEIGIEDIDANNEETTNISVACEWLKMYLLENEPAPSAQAKRDARDHGDIKEHTLIRAVKRLGVRVHSTSEPGRPHMTVWSLPVPERAILRPRGEDADE